MSRRVGSRLAPGFAHPAAIRLTEQFELFIAEGPACDARFVGLILAFFHRSKLRPASVLWECSRVSATSVRIKPRKCVAEMPAKLTVQSMALCPCHGHSGLANWEGSDMKR